MQNKYKSELIYNSAIYLSANIISAALPFFIIPFLTRTLSPIEYGQVAMFQTFVGIINSLVGFKAVSYVARKYYDVENSIIELKKYVATYLQLVLASVIICLLLSLIYNDKISNWTGVQSTWQIYAVIVSMSYATTSLILVLWQLSKNPMNYGLMQVSKGVFNSGLTLIAVICFGRGASGPVEAQLITASIFLLLTIVVLVKNNFFLFLHWNKNNHIDALRFGLPMVLHASGGLLLASFDRFIINDKLGLAQVGIYMVAVQISMGISLVFDAINKSYVPWLYERLKRDIKNEKIEIVRNTYIGYGLIILGVSIIFWSSPWFVKVIAGVEYADAAEVLGWLALGQGFGGMYLLVTNYIFYAKRTVLLTTVTLFSGAINMAALLVFIPLWGIKGAAIAFSLAMGVRFVLTWVAAQISHPMPWFKFVR